MNQPSTMEEVGDLIRGEGAPILARGAGTKSALFSGGGEVEILDLSKFSGIVEYEPSEYVFTARAGTSLAEINEALLSNNHYLPFDPLLVDKGATLGGTVASGLSGPGMFRFGGIRDFIIGARFAIGSGKIVKGGGKVVKNAAGFDYPKFLVGSLGRFAVLLELTFKVFPRPDARLSLRFDSKNAADSLEKLLFFSRSKWDIDALELEAEGPLFLRLAGDSSGLRSRADCIMRELGNGTILTEEQAFDYWAGISCFSWAGAQNSYAKVPISPRIIPRLDTAIEDLAIERRYGMGGNVAWLSWSSDKVALELELILKDLELSALVLRGEADTALIGHKKDFAIHALVKKAFDANGRFPDLP
jgi:glycolate oxidase FAD binding subunit